MEIVTGEKRAHAKFSASGSHIWTHCFASVGLSEKAPPSPESAFALEGTEAHACLELVLREYFERKEIEPLGPLVHAVKEMGLYSDEIIEHIFTTAKAIRDLTADAQNPEIKIEHKVDLSFVYPNTFGTVDFALIEEFGTLTIVDLKYGAGIPVEAKDNSQLIFYALGLAHEYHYNFQEIKIVIIQPRAEHPDGPMREWTLSVEELLEWKTKFILSVKESLGKNPKFNSGDHCRWCRAKPICPELSTTAMKQALIDFDAELGAVALPAINDKLPIAYLPQALDASEKLTTWIKALKEAAFNALKRGEKIPGYKLVEKRSTRKWVNAQEAALEARPIFGEEIFETRLKTPAQFEKTFGKKDVKGFLSSYASDVSTGVTLVKESDPRPEAKTVAEIDFEEDFDKPENYVVSYRAPVLIPKLTKTKPEKVYGTPWLKAAIETSKKLKKLKPKKKEEKKNGKRNRKKR